MFFEQEYPRLFRYISYLTDRETAQEICQEVFLRWFRLGSTVKIESPPSWLRKVGTNLAYDYLRQENVRRRWETIPEAEYEQMSVSIEPDLLQLEVQDILGRLSWRDQLLLKLKLAGLSYREIGDTMEIAYGSVGTMLMRAMKRFREEYEREEAKYHDIMSG